MSWGYLSHLHHCYIFGCESAVTWGRLTREASAIGWEEPEEFPIGPILQGLFFAYIINISLSRCLHLFISPSPDVLYVNGQLRQLADDDDDDDGAVRCFPYRGVWDAAAVVRKVRRIGIREVSVSFLLPCSSWLWHNVTVTWLQKEIGTEMKENMFLFCWQPG